MKQVFVICFFILNGCCLIAQTQEKSFDQEEGRLKKTEKELNDVYKKVLTEYKSDSIFIKHLKRSQKLWLQLRDAEMEMKYPDTLNGRYSTPYVMCTYSYKEELTRERIIALNVWLKGVTKWEQCDGSLKEKN